MNPETITQFESGGALLRQSIAGLSKNDLLWIPPADANVGLWSIQQILIHLQDADIIWTGRMKRIIAEDNPPIIGYDESKFAANLFYDKQDPDRAIQLFDLNRKQFTKVLRKLHDATFTRTGQHNERGPITLAQCIPLMVGHVTHHIEFIHKKRANMGKSI